MAPFLKHVLKWTGIAVGVLLLVAAGLSVYVYSLVPKPVDKLPPLQAELFRKPDRLEPVDGRFLFKSATELAAMIRSREATSEAIVRAHLSFIKNENYRLNAIVWLREREAIDEARAADAAVASGGQLGPLHGVPVTVKEMYGVKGLPLTMNAKMFTLIAREDAAIVAQLKKAGAVVLGTTNVPYMLGDFQTSGEIYPTGNNPFNTDFTPGGSTGGGAAAVAAGFSSLELGSDLGGSIRVPAAFCGLYGFKATFGVLNITEGTNPDPSMKFTRLGLASPGFLARTAGDLQLMWEAVRDTKIDPAFQQPNDWPPPSTRTLTDYQIAWTDNWNHAGGPVRIGREAKQQTAEFVSALARNGVVTENAVPDTYDDMARTFLKTYASMMAEGQPWLMRKLMAFDMRKLDNGSPNFRAFDEGLDDVSDEAWRLILRERRRLNDTWTEFFRGRDFLVTPITYGPAFKKTAPGTPIDGDDGKVPYMDYVPYAYVFNATGHPTLSIPMGLGKDGLPIGVQIVGPRFSDPELLHFGKLIEGLTPGFIRPKGFGG